MSEAHSLNFSTLVGTLITQEHSNNAWITSQYVALDAQKLGIFPVPTS